MNLTMRKIVSICAPVYLLLNLGGCSTTETNQINAPEIPSAQRTPSFASSTICAENPFLQKYQCSFTRVEQAARSGDPDAQYALGYLYYYGIGTTQDQQAGLMWIRRAAAQGQSVAKDALKRISGPVSNAPKTSTMKSSASPSNSNSSANVNSSSAVNNSTPAQASEKAPNQGLSDILPNFGQDRVNTTQSPPPTVDLNNVPQN